MDFQETPDLEFSESIVPDADANVYEETPNLVFTEEIAAATEADEIDDLDEPDQYVENANVEEEDEQNVNDNGTGMPYTLHALCMAN